MSKEKQELEQIIGKGKPVQDSYIAKLPYLQAIIKETFRLHPAVPFLVPRKADANVEIERFLGSKIDAIGHNFELLPFGSGRRICPDISLATKMLPLMLGSFINCFNWKLEDGTKVEDMDMDDKFGLSLEKSQKLRIVLEKVYN
ncbi:unnamed protein product [Vicia faba]|uniref:Cytochrome P450 n=1 Tax=Vicia faba TaxID=3906 RepID=A0AAV1B6Y9_VICFA|nr:unnamed protein product [Vicia faba]